MLVKWTGPRGGDSVFMGREEPAERPRQRGAGVVFELSFVLHS